MPDALPPDKPAVDAIPDWSRLPEMLPCPACGYNLRMLTASRCPECGVTVKWPNVLAAVQQRNESQLFEHQWRRRPIRSFLSTTWSLVRPWSFWRQPSLESAPRVGPVVIQTLATLMMLAIVTAVPSTIHAWWRNTNPQLRSPFHSYANFRLFIAILRYRTGLNYRLDAACQLMANLIAFGLLLFACRGTCGRYRLSWRAVVRCVCYCGITMSLYATALEFPLGIASRLNAAWSNSILKSVLLLYWFDQPMPLLAFAASIVMAFRDRMGLRRAIAIPITLIALGYAVGYATFILAAVAFDTERNPVSDAILWMAWWTR